MNCPKCNNKLVWRNPGGKEANRSKRAGEFKLKCLTCNEKWLYRDGENSHPYQTRENQHLVGMYVKFHPKIAKHLKGVGNVNREINVTLDKKYGLGIY